MSFADATIERLPRPLRPFAERHHELIKFAIVGATTFVIDSAIFYTLKLTVLEPKPVTAKIIAGIVAVIASYILNREWSFQNRGGRERHHEALLFFGFSGVGVLLSMAPLWVSSYVLELRVPNVSLTVENLADFVSAYILGNLLQMAFRFWVFRRWVFPDEVGGHDPEKVLESLTTGGIAEALEDGYESRHARAHDGVVTPLRRSADASQALRRSADASQAQRRSADASQAQRRSADASQALRRSADASQALRRSTDAGRAGRGRNWDQLGDSSDRRVSKTS